MCVPKARTWLSALWLLLPLRLLLPPPPLGASASHCTLPSPMNVHFVSKNMKNVLHWLPPEGITEGKVNYTVKYLIYGTNKWIKNSECRNISQTWCDLSNETYDHKELYHARVKAFLNGNCSGWAESARFNPFTDTKIDPPAFSLSSTEKSISVIVTPPKKWQRGPGEEPEYLHQIYPGLQYNVTVFNKKIKKRWTFCIKNNSLEVQQLEPNTGYCVTVQIYITPLLLSGFSEERCIDTLKDPTFKQTTTIIFGYILPVFLTILIILVPSCCIYRYIHKAKQTYPKSLVLKHSNQFGGDVFVPSEKIVVNFITVTIVDEYKNSQENTHFLDHASNSDRNNAEAISSKEKLEEKHSPDSCLIEGSENEQDGNRPSVTTLGSYCTPGQRHNDDVVVYEFDMRAEDGISTENKQKEFHSNENISALEELLHNSPKAPSLIPEKGPSYYLPFDVRAPNIFVVQTLSELYLNELDPAPDNLYDDLQPPLINLMTEKLDRAFCPELGMVTDICLVHDQKQHSLDPVGCVPKEPQAFTNAMTRCTASPYCPQFVTWASKDHQAAMEIEEQSLIVAWGPQTGRLYLPSLSSFRNEIHEQIIENKKYEKSLGKGLFSRLYERPCSDEPLEEKQEVYLRQLKEQWGLHIQTQA